MRAGPVTGPVCSVCYVLLRVTGPATCEACPRHPGEAPDWPFVPPPSPSREVVIHPGGHFCNSCCQDVPTALFEVPGRRLSLCLACLDFARVLLVYKPAHGFEGGEQSECRICGLSEGRHYRRPARLPRSF